MALQHTSFEVRTTPAAVAVVTLRVSVAAVTAGSAPEAALDNSAVVVCSTGGSTLTHALDVVDGAPQPGSAVAGVRHTLALTFVFGRGP